MTPEKQIQKYLDSQQGWKGDLLRRLHKTILSASPEIVEEWKWDVPVFTQNGMVCAISAFKDHVKINFFKGAKLQDKNKLLNAGLESKQHRAIDFKEGDNFDEKKLRELIEEALNLNKK